MINHLTISNNINHNNPWTVICPIIRPYMHSKDVQHMRDFSQHGKNTTLHHCLNVVMLSYIITSKFNISVNMNTLLIGALLHDFFLYDWHDINSPKWHGFAHPKIATQNAINIYHVNYDIQHVIKTHMFPLTINQIPKSKEALIVSIADKICAIKEFANSFVNQVKTLKNCLITKN